ncbi:DUF3017 domain-containing protein [Nocardioides sp.]|uniref:DUF3017 domain-containing protein n=1 Tax=Nocardioides sp. TaxID=35761 RepID=UPI001A30DEE1|nr:DUF3017 domain-containing protein [Nocardioides sp.]MBJ7357329.1 DUF3017 domain-containing protein [Nocardioides sp.]
MTDEPDLPAPEPEDGPGDGDEEERRYPSTIGGAFYLVILAVCGAGIAIVASGDWRLGVRVLAVALMVAAGLRLVLPSRDAGMLAVRHRAIDVTVLAALGGLIYFLASSIPEQPG